jgi:hypothetical protein
VTDEDEKPMLECHHCGYRVSSTCCGCGANLVELDHEWSAREVALLAGVSPRTAQWWAAHGVIGPTEEHPKLWSGRKQYYSFADIVAHRVLDDLNKAGVPRPIAIGVAEDVACWAGRWMLDPYDPDDAHRGVTRDEWSRTPWLLVPLNQATVQSVKNRTADMQVLLPYNRIEDWPGLATPEELEDGERVVPIDDDRLAYFLGRTITEIAQRVDGYLRSHNKIAQARRPMWMTE